MGQEPPRLTPRARRARGLTLATYARTSERLLSAAAGRPVVLSPRDWQLLGDWYERGIPLQLIEEALTHAPARRKRTSSRPRALWRVSPAVEEAWAVIAQGRLGSDAPAAAVTPIRSSELWRRRLTGEPPGALADLLRSLLARAAAGECGLEEALEEELLAGVDPQALAAATDAVRRELAAHRGRMSREAAGRTERRAIIERLRGALDLPRGDEE